MMFAFWFGGVGYRYGCFMFFKENWGVRLRMVINCIIPGTKRYRGICLNNCLSSMMAQWGIDYVDDLVVMVLVVGVCLGKIKWD